MQITVITKMPKFVLHFFRENEELDMEQMLYLETKKLHRYINDEIFSKMSSPRQAIKANCFCLRCTKKTIFTESMKINKAT